jgi:anti-sigma factor ChrR (cupin superfamily)
MSEQKDRAPQVFVEALEGSDSDAYELAGALSHAFEALPPRDLRARLLQTVAAGAEPYAPFWSRLGEMFDLSVEQMRQVLAELTQPERWQAAPIPGVQLMHFDGGPLLASADCGLVRLAPGTPFPEHTHLGLERVLLLAGGYTDASGKIFAAGDRHEMQRGSAHALRADAANGCLFAVLLESGIQIDGIGKLGGT